MILLRRHLLFLPVALLALAEAAPAQNNPRIGYVYPAGGQQGAAFEVTVGGQYLDGASDVCLSGDGVEATVLKHAKPLTQRQINELREKLQEVQKRMQEERKKGARGNFRDTAGLFTRIAAEVGTSAEDLQALADLRKRMNDPKQQLNPQISETVTLNIRLAPDAAPGLRQLRLVTLAGLSNPLWLHVGPLPEYCESEPNDELADIGVRDTLPAVINGQILPGDVDRFAFHARKGQRLVAAAAARELIPYLADAVPGWFQATLVLYDPAGKEVAFADDYRFNPDPVLCYEVPEDGTYVLEIKDAIYRGREDFVYRVTLGEIPFVTGIFPLGGRDGEKSTVELAGWNLPVDKLTIRPQEDGPGVQPVSVETGQELSNRVPFAVDTLPDGLEEEPNDDSASAQRVETPLFVNGRIDRPGDWDVYCFHARAGGQIVAEVLARRLGSPLDSVLELTDAEGRRLALCDDCEDKGAGMITHHADSQLHFAIPADGTYYVRLGDTQRRGGPAYAYRLRVSPPRPDFELRVVPASLNARAGTSEPITVYALRRDGFDGDVLLQLKDAPAGFVLSGGWIPAGQEQVRMTLTVPPVAEQGPATLVLEGRAEIDGQEVRRTAVPAEDMMQAFAYRHLVPADDWMVTVTGRGRYRSSLRILGPLPVRFPTGGTARVRLSLPGGPLVGQVGLELNEPPEGIAIKRIVPDPEGAAIVLSVDAEKATPGLKGNLIVDAFTEVSRGPAGQANKRRMPLGTLPAIPFEIVKPQTWLDAAMESASE